MEKKVCSICRDGKLIIKKTIMLAIIGGESMEEEETVISFDKKKVLLDGKEVKGITDIEIKKHASNIADVTMKLKANIKGLDVD